MNPAVLVFFIKKLQSKTSPARLSIVQSKFTSFHDCQHSSRVQNEKKLSPSMEDKIVHLLWGLLFSFLYNVLFVISTSILRLCSAISPFQTLALITLSETASLLPLSTLVYREWNIKTTREWIVFTSFVIMMVCHVAAETFCDETYRPWYGSFFVRLKIHSSRD